MRSLLRSLALRIPAVRDLKRQRDDLLRALSDREGAPVSGSGERWIQHRPYERLEAEPGEVKSSVEPQPAVVARLVQAYRASANPDQSDRESHWSHIFGEKHRWIDVILRAQDVAAVTRAVSRPHENHLFYGFETVYVDEVDALRASAEKRKGYALRCKDLLLRLAEAVGVLRVENPEGIEWGRNLDIGTDDLVTRLEAFFGFAITLPPVYDGHFGLATPKGVINDRAINALYVAHRIRRLVMGMDRPHIAEIGGGLGHLARYCHLLGIRNYTLIDIPITALCQGYFLMHTLGADRVCLEGEPSEPSEQEIKLRSPAFTDKRSPRFDLVVNVDSLTEIGQKAAVHYVDWICAKASRFLSINHEVNRFTVRSLVEGRPGIAIERYPYWMRNGFVEELFEMSSVRGK